MDLWFTEEQTPLLTIGLKVRKVLEYRQTGYQELAVLETEQYGRMLVLDGCIQTTEVDEPSYHEMLVHVPMATHPNPRRVAVVGGGDGGSIREMLKHPSVEEAVLIEIDAGVVEAAKRWLPSLSSGLEDKRVQIVHTDGKEYMAKVAQGELPPFDVVVVDSTDPVKAATGLFSEAFYQTVRQALNPDGILVAQTESPWVNQDLVTGTYQAMARTFPLARLYLSVVPTYPGGLWCFALGSLGPDPLEPQGKPPQGPCKYYTPELHKAAFVLPAFVQELIGG
ncbi:MULTISPECIES: polyamine aminopropyltransferase [Limnochorda]|uniref:polyamine aminopropyltransferase n=1 Tax=Limnochorda TaxID=1676651 RepID=UPI001832C373|nr:polyamine aminopropyltransferase [Limnochorda pilosa]MBO2485842.1 spermidine synthase [Bacillota bacterium]MBO2519220.1 spermidine synthase [Bacillota bacterium]NMA71055.1 polyamine aminopropyltransferase [Bacillota bacterium]